MSERENVAKGLEELMMHGGDVTHRDRKNLLGKAVALLRAVPEEGVPEQAPVAWRWRNPGGQWRYREEAPAQPPAAPLEKDAEIEPLYGHPWRSMDNEPSPTCVSKTGICLSPRVCDYEGKCRHQPQGERS